MTKRVAVCGYMAEVCAERLRSLGLDCKAYPVSMTEHNLDLFFQGLSKREVVVFVFPPPFSEPSDELLWCQLGAALGMQKECLVDVSHREGLTNPFLGKTLVFSFYGALSNYLSETC